MATYAAYWKAFRVSLQTKLEYRTDFVLGFGGALLLQAAGLGTLWIVLTRSPQLAGWQGREVAFLFGLTVMMQGLSELLFNHIWYVPTYLLRGQFDRLLTYPVKSLPFFLITSPELHAFGNLSGGLLILILSGASLGLPWQVWPLIPFWVICGCLVHSSVLTFCGALCFKVIGRQGYHFWVANALLQATRYPLGVFPKVMQYILLLLVPFAATNYLPASWATGRLNWPAAVLAPLLAAVLFTWLAFRSWEWGLRQYESTGS